MQLAKHTSNIQKTAGDVHSDLAIAFFLGADIGGMGSEMTVNENKDTILWKIKKYTGEEQTIEINKKDSNKY